MRPLISSLALLLPLSACSIERAQLVTPSHFAETTERLDVTGLGGYKSGSFELAGIPGHFSRGADRLDVGGTSRFTGGSRFALTASPFLPALSGRCSYGEMQMSRGILFVTPERFLYSCDLGKDGRPGAGRLHIADPAPPTGTLHGRAEREGVVDYEGRRLVVRSVHRFEGGKLPSSTPLGYAFVADGRQIGAVDLNGGKKRIMAPRSGPDREAVIAASLALSLLWDPANLYDDH